MKWDSFIRLVADLPVIDLVTVVQMTGQQRSTIRVQLHRWSNAGKVIRLRRGFYVLAEPYRKRRLSALRLANEMYLPSYLSSLWALSHYGFIPDAVPGYQSVTPRVTRRFDNAFGSFVYMSLKQDFFWGYTSRVVDGELVVIAHPEKAVLDLFHLSSGEWTTDRIEGMRFQQLALVDRVRLAEYVERFDSPRISRAGQRLDALIQAEPAFGRIG